MASKDAPRFLPQEIIRAARDKRVLSEAEIRFFVEGLRDERITEGQVAAFAMAVFFNGLSRPECVALTRAMMESGDVLDWSGHDLPGPVVDKHSTGGVGDKVSLMLAPILAACGAVVPMISGRGLGHTGGTLDKLESIPGYGVRPDNQRFGEVLREAGCAIIGQTANLAPADKRFYSIRDVTATVESIPLITASILSKKLAAGLSRLVLDVKVGSGAFIPEPARARELAQSLVSVAQGAGLACSALITDMNEVLGWTAGNAIETREAIEYLRGQPREARLHEVTTELAAELLHPMGLATDLDDARAKVQQVLDDGRAAEAFARMVTALGGPADLLERHEAHLPLAPVVRPVTPEQPGTIESIDVRAMGLVVLSLGGGRRRADDTIDPSVGLAEIRGRGAQVGPDSPIAMVYARSEAEADAAIAGVQAAVTVGQSAPAAQPVVYERVS